jgi:uncharacterized membrane protein (DUF485 family)
MSDAGMRYRRAALIDTKDLHCQFSSSLQQCQRRKPRVSDARQMCGARLSSTHVMPSSTSTTVCKHNTIRLDINTMKTNTPGIDLSDASSSNTATWMINEGHVQTFRETKTIRRRIAILIRCLTLIFYLLPGHAHLYRSKHLGTHLHGCPSVKTMSWVILGIISVTAAAMGGMTYGGSMYAERLKAVQQQLAEVTLSSNPTTAAIERVTKGEMESIARATEKGNEIIKTCPRIGDCTDCNHL